MKKMTKKDFDTIGIIVGVIIGIFIGVLISNKLSNNTKEEEIQDVVADINSGYVYLLQLGKYSKASDAEEFINELKSKNIDSVYVYDNNSYFIYTKISNNNEEIIREQEAYKILGYNGFIKKEYLYNRSNEVIDNTESSLIKYNFYNEMIRCLIDSLSDENFVIDEEILSGPLDIELVTWINMLSTIKNSDYKSKLELQSYKMIVEKSSNQ